MDTVEANLALGFDADGRRFCRCGADAGSPGHDPGGTAQQQSGQVAGTAGPWHRRAVVSAAIEIDPNPHNKRYLAAKRDKFGHALSID